MEIKNSIKIMLENEKNNIIITAVIICKKSCRLEAFFSVTEINNYQRERNMMQYRENKIIGKRTINYTVILYIHSSCIKCIFLEKIIE